MRADGYPSHVIDVHDIRGYFQKAAALPDERGRGLFAANEALAAGHGGATTIDTGLKVCREIDGSLYPKGVRVSDEEMLALNIERHTFRGEWNDTISPRRPR